MPYIIAEMACAHDGEVEKAKALIDAAAEAQVDAIQLQLFRRDYQVAPHHGIYPLLGTLEFSDGEWKDIYGHAKTTDLAIFAFTYDIPSLELALELGIDGIKLSSADLSNPEMLEAAARSGLPVTLGTGASYMDEISRALSCIGASGGDKVVLMHGVQNFPTTIKNANIKRIRMLQREFNLPVGYQDHTEADLEISKILDLAAVGMDVCIIEKHITQDRSEKGTDYQAALEPEELVKFVKYIRDTSVALGSDEIKEFSESDMKYRKFQKKSITAACTIPEGSEITRDKILFLRNDTPGLSPMDLPDILGKKAKKQIDRFEQIQLHNMID